MLDNRVGVPGNNDYHSINNDYHSINNDYHSINNDYKYHLKGTPMVFFITKGKVRELDHRNSRCGDVYHF